jgi:hypothetical protein
VFRTGLFEQREQLRQALAYEIRVAAGADEIGIAGPSRDNMNMQMVGQSRPCALAHVYTYIKAVRLYGKSQRLLGVSNQFCHFKKLFVICCVEIRDVPGRRDKQMAVVIGKPIQHRDTAFGPPQDKIFVVVLRGFDIFTNEALVLVGKTLNVSDSPRRPEIFAFQPAVTSNCKSRPVQFTKISTSSQALAQEAASSVSGQ